jgi:DNA-binding NarL/FixJ family response regulator
VDDSRVVRERLAQILNQRAGIEIAWQAGDVPEAQTALAQDAPDAVILDIHLPTGSGIDLLKTIKHRTPGTTVIMLTNYPVEILRHRCCELGAEAFFDKSTEFHKVFDVLRKMKSLF